MNTISLTKHYTALTAAKSTIVQGLCILNFRININIYIKVSSHYCIHFNVSISVAL